jgi:L-amino acid N-acyltransferase YncA
VVVPAIEPATPDGTVIRSMRAEDAEQVLEIYQDGLDTGDASFETVAPTWERWDAAHLPDHRYVCLVSTAGRVIGWVALAPVSTRAVYAGVAELSIYVGGRARGLGVGTALLRAVIDSSEAAGIWSLQTGIFPENTASLALHERAGFRVVGIRERIGRHHGRWRDVVFLERRSTRVGG